MNLIAAGKAPRIVQPEEGASYEPYITAKPELAEIDWSKTRQGVHDFIRGNDKVPGAWTVINGQKITLFGSTMWKRPEPPASAREVEAQGYPAGKVWAHDGGLLFKCGDGKYVR